MPRPESAPGSPLSRADSRASRASSPKSPSPERRGGGGADEPASPEAPSQLLSELLRHHQESLAKFLHSWLAQQGQLVDQLSCEETTCGQAAPVSRWSAALPLAEPKKQSQVHARSVHSFVSDAAMEPRSAWQSRVEKQGTGISCATAEEPSEQAQGEDPPGGKQHRSTLFRSRSQEERERLQQAKVRGMKNVMTKSSFNTLLERRMGCLQRTAQGQIFELCSLVVLLANTLFMGVEIEFLVNNPQMDQPSLPFFIINALFASFFMLEVILRLLGQRFEFLFGEHRLWNCIDAIAAMASMLEVVADSARLSSETPNAQSSIDPNSQRMIRVVRVARLVRIFRITRVVRFVVSLRTLVYSIASTMKSLGWSLVLLGVIIYSCGIFFTQAVFDHLSETAANDASVGMLRSYWGSLGSSMLTLFQSITGGVSWADVANPLAEAHILVKVAFVLFVAFCLLAVLNVITAVFCQSAIDSAQRDQDGLLQSQISARRNYLKWVKSCFAGMDVANTGNVTLVQLENHISDDRMQAFLASLEIETDDVWTLFKLLDADCSQTISLDEFAHGCLRLRGSARSVDLALVAQELEWLAEKVTVFMAYVEDQLESLTGKRASAAYVRKASLMNSDSSRAMLRLRTTRRDNRDGMSRDGMSRDNTASPTSRESSGCMR